MAEEMRAWNQAHGLVKFRISSHNEENLWRGVTMALTTTVPTTITPEAADRIAELGYQREFEQMLEQTRQIVPGLRSIAVKLVLPYDTGDETGIRIEAFTSPPSSPDNSIWNRWSNWKITHFPPDVFRHFQLFIR
jgi:hypothetical protein